MPQDGSREDKGNLSQLVSKLILSKYETRRILLQIIHNRRKIWLEELIT